MTRHSLLYIAIGALGVLLLGAIGFGVFVASGLYDIAAFRPHTTLVRNTLKFLQQRSVRFHARVLTAPELEEPHLVQYGLILYREHCVVCHGAPGESRERVGVGLNPNPPPLEQAIEQWSDAEIYWVTAYGLKMAGMPSFLLGKTPEEIWAIVAFVRQMNRLSPQDYWHLIQALEEAPNTAPVTWVGETRVEALARIEGDPEQGKELLRWLGCGTCHTIPGVRSARGHVGPPLDRWVERQYISGQLVNTPANLVAWLVDPLAIDPSTAMPSVNATESQARDMAAYLYTLGTRPRTAR